jgi:hypothetical protein
VKKRREMNILSQRICWTTEGGGGVNQLLPCLNNYSSFKLFAEIVNDDHIKEGK